MKRIFAVVMAAVMALCMTACGGSEPQTEDRQPTSDVFVRSDFDGRDVFFNNYTGITVKMPGDWYVATDSELVALFFDGQVTSGEFASWTAADYAKQQLVPDFIVQDLANGNNLIVLYENLTMLDGGSDMTEEQYIDTSEAVINAAGSTVTAKGTVQLCGMEFATITSTSQVNGAQVVQYQAVRRFGDYMAAITATDMTSMGESNFWMMFE